MGMADSRGAEAVVISRTGFTLIRTNKHRVPLKQSPAAVPL